MNILRGDFVLSRNWQVLTAVVLDLVSNQFVGVHFAVTNNADLGTVQFQYASGFLGLNFEILELIVLRRLIGAIALIVLEAVEVTSQHHVVLFDLLGSQLFDFREDIQANGLTALDTIVDVLHSSNQLNGAAIMLHPHGLNCCGRAILYFPQREYAVVPVNAVQSTIRDWTRWFDVDTSVDV